VSRALPSQVASSDPVDATPHLNAAWTRTLAYIKKDLMTEPFLVLVHPDDREARRGPVSDLLVEERALELVGLMGRQPWVVEQLDDLRYERRRARRQLLWLGWSPSKSRAHVSVDDGTRHLELIDALSEPPSAREHRLENDVVDRHGEAGTHTWVGATALRRDDTLSTRGEDRNALPRDTYFLGLPTARWFQRAY
jgi:hypothetical protein